MNSNNLELLRRIYDEVHAALWAILLACISYFILFIVPKIPEVSNRADMLRAQEISAEHEWYCNRWGMGPGTEKHNQCMSDLQQFRAAVERRIADDIDFL